jgi:DNA polymerase III subunit delta'
MIKVMSFKDVIGHKKSIELLRRAIMNDRVVHSYLFLGNEGIGKKYVALQFAKALNCLGREAEESDACDHCLSCKKIDAELHPDVTVLEPEGQAIKVDRVRQMLRDLAYRPYEGKRRVCILTAADRMAPNMSNTLLKTLEEPPLHTLIILLANSSRAILPTILSRCQQIPFNPLPLSSLTSWLVEKKGIHEVEARLLASLSEGSPGKALRLKEEIGQIQREDLLQRCLGVNAFSFGEIEGWVESMPSNREELVLTLEVAKTLLRDLVIMKVLGDGSKLIHSDLLQEIGSVASGLTLSSLMARLESIHQTILTISPLRGNGNTTLALEAMMLSWAEG